jgi:hypothetical protein
VKNVATRVWGVTNARFFEIFRYYHVAILDHLNGLPQEARACGEKEPFEQRIQRLHARGARVDKDAAVCQHGLKTNRIQRRVAALNTLALSVPTLVIAQVPTITVVVAVVVVVIGRPRRLRACVGGVDQPLIDELIVRVIRFELAPQAVVRRPHVLRWPMKNP